MTWADTCEGMVQTTNPKGAAKAVVGMHNPLVAGSNPAGPTFEKPRVVLRGYFLGYLHATCICMRR
jgi:hypothetical protein